MFKHGMTPEQIEMLEQIFTKLTWRGWKTPDWIALLK